MSEEPATCSLILKCFLLLGKDGLPELPGVVVWAWLGRRLDLGQNLLDSVVRPEVDARLEESLFSQNRLHDDTGVGHDHLFGISMDWEERLAGQPLPSRQADPVQLCGLGSRL